MSEDVDEVGLHARQHNLGLGVAEAGVELEDLRAVLGEHEAAVEAAGVGDALCGELGDDALLDVDHGLELLVGDHGHRAVDAHAARVGAKVAVEGALVVLRGGQGHEGLAVGEGQKRALGPFHHLFHDDGRAGIAKDAAEALVNTLEGLLGGLGHDDALAGGKSVGLDHDGAADPLDVGRAGGLVGKAAVGCGGHAGARHDLLGELLRALHLGGLAVGAEARDARRAHGIGDARHERRLRADDHEADAVFACPLGHGHGILVVQLDLGRQAVHAAVARRHVDLARARGLGELAKKGVLAPASAQQKDIDRLTSAHDASNLKRSAAS